MQRLLRATAVSFLIGLGACCADNIDCTGQYLFRTWHESAFTSADGGSQVPPGFLDLSGAHYGPGQNFYAGGCEYLVDIESDLTESSGTFTFTHATPSSTACFKKEGTQTWSLDCDTLTVTTPDGTITFTDNGSMGSPTPAPDGGP